MGYLGRVGGWVVRWEVSIMESDPKYWDCGISLALGTWAYKVGMGY